MGIVISIAIFRQIKGRFDAAPSGFKADEWVAPGLLGSHQLLILDFASPAICGSGCPTKDLMTFLGVL